MAEEGTSERIIKINIEEEMKSAYIDYSMSVIVSRALPDVRDGLKPVHRRVLFGMNEMGNTYDKPHKKAAKAVRREGMIPCVLCGNGFPGRGSYPKQYRKRGRHYVDPERNVFAAQLFKGIRQKQRFNNS